MSDDERMGGDYEGGAGYDFDNEDPDHIEYVGAVGVAWAWNRMLGALERWRDWVLE